MTSMFCFVTYYTVVNKVSTESWTKEISKTRDAIIDAYLELIFEKKDQKITISELAQRANIARKTFYLHYESLEDIMRDAAHRKIDELLHILEKKRFFSNPFETDVLFQSLNQLMEPDIEFYRFLSGKSQYLFLDGSEADYYQYHRRGLPG